MVEKLSTPWPEGCLGAVSLTFDDGVASQIKRGVAILEEHGLRGTFYLPLRWDDWRERLSPWRKVMLAGHEIGNHSLTHTCSRGFSDTPDVKCLENMTLAEMEAEVVEAERRLRELFPEQARRTFCYPCYQCDVGEGETRESYVPIIARHFIAARGRGEVANHPLTCDPSYLWSWNAEGMTGPQMVGYAERAAAGRWVILTFHGIHGDHLSVSDADFRELCGFLARHKNRIWTAPVVTVAERIVEWRKNLSA